MSNWGPRQQTVQTQFVPPRLCHPVFPWFETGKWKYVLELYKMVMSKSKDLFSFPSYLDGLVSTLIDMTFERISPTQVSEILRSGEFMNKPLSAPPCNFFRSLASVRSFYTIADVANAFNELGILLEEANEIIPPTIPPPFLISFTPSGNTLSVFETSSVTLTRKQILLILFSAAIGAMNDVNPPECPELVSPFSVWNLFVSTDLAETGYAAAHCLMAYFIRSTDPVLGQPYWEEPVNFLRKQVVRDISWQSLACPFAKIRPYLGKTSLDDSPAQFKADFANKIVGGGVLNRGSAQEEMFFCSAPECIAARIFCPIVKDNESLCLSGVRIFSVQEGYSYTRKFAGFSPRDKYLKRHTIFTLDALELPRSGSKSQQYKVEIIEREIKKAYSGFSFATAGSDIATGNWGSGAFRGDVELKFIEQWIAASALGIELVHYYAYGNEILQNLPQFMSDVTTKYDSVGKLYKALLRVLKYQDYAFRIPDDGPSGLFAILSEGPDVIKKKILDSKQSKQMSPSQRQQQLQDLYASGGSGQYGSSVSRPADYQSQRQQPYSYPPSRSAQSDYIPVEHSDRYPRKQAPPSTSSFIPFSQQGQSGKVEDEF